MGEHSIGSAAVPPRVPPVGPNAPIPGRPVALLSVLAIVVDRAAHRGLLISNLSTDRLAETLLVETPAPADVRAWAEAMAGCPPRQVTAPGEIITTSKTVIGAWTVTFRSVLPVPPKNGGMT